MGARREHLKMGQAGDTKLTLWRNIEFLKDASKTAPHIGRRRISQGKLQPTERNVRFHKDASETASSRIKRRRIPKGCLQNCISLPPSGFQSIWDNNSRISQMHSKECIHIVHCYRTPPYSTCTKCYTKCNKVQRCTYKTSLENLPFCWIPLKISQASAVEMWHLY